MTAFRCLRRIIRPAAGAVFAACIGAAVTARADRGAESTRRFQDDLRFLHGKMIPAKYRLRRATDGEAEWAALQDRIAQLRRIVERLGDVGGRIDAAERRLHYLKNYEVEPKLRDLERVRLYGQQRIEGIDRRLSGIKREIDAHNARPHVFTPEQAAARSLYDSEARVLNDRYGAATREREGVVAETTRAFEQAVEAVTHVQQEMSEVGARHGRLATEFGDVAGEYASVREPLAVRLEEIENDPGLAVVTSPFGYGSVSPGEAGTLARPAPLGAGVPPRALDQLRIVTASSLAAAGTADDHLRVGPVTSGMVSGYQFDTTRGLPPVELPEVDSPGSVAVDTGPESAAVPLVLEPGPTIQPNAPAEILASARVHQAESRQQEHFFALDRLYAERKQLAQQGPSASPAEWTRVTNEISTTHAEINFTEVSKRLTAGSKLMDLTIRAKPRARPEVVVPAPGN